MAPKSNKKSGENINSRLALVMKSGKGQFNRDMHTDSYRLISLTYSHSGIQVDPQDPP